MTVESKIHKNEDLQKLKEYYIDKKMSTVDIEQNSESIFGFYISRGTIYRTLKKHNINVRNKSVSVSRAMSNLDLDKIYVNENIIEWIDGFNLGDGYINWDKRGGLTKGARFVIGSITKSWSQYAMSGLNIYSPSELKQYGRVRKRTPNLSWVSQTCTHPDIQYQADRWYPNGKKKVPKDVRITPTSIMLWYLGDGSIVVDNKTNAVWAQFATCSFDREDIHNILRFKLENLGIRTRYNKGKNDIIIPSNAISKFFNLIGRKSPVPEYQYKFEYPKWLDFIRLSEIVKNDKEKYRAQYYYKTGQIECSKSPGGKMLLFTEKQAEKLKNKLCNR